MGESVSIVLVGVGGYGGTYVNALLDQPELPGACIAGVVDPFPDACRRVDDLRGLGVPFHHCLEDFYAESRADLAVISSPIHLHRPQTCSALAHGSSVLCEKPLGPLFQDAQAMIEARDAAGGFVAIGYQWSFSPAMQALKRDIMAGYLGRPKRLRSLVLWPRDERYYRRNGWAGARQTSAGDWVLDSPVNNAAAHYLHAMFYILGPVVDRSDPPVQVTGEVYRANAISNYDTGAVHAVTAGGADVFFYATHAVAESRGPEFIYEFERCVVRYGGEQKTILAEFDDGTRRDYGDPNAEATRKLWDSVRALTNSGPIACGPEAAAAQTLCMNGMQASAAEVRNFPVALISREGKPGAQLTVVNGLAETFITCYEQGILPAAGAASWAQAGMSLDVRGMTTFSFPSTVRL